MTDADFADFVEKLRTLITSAGAESVRLALGLTERTTWRPGTVDTVDHSYPPNVDVTADDATTLTHAQALIVAPAPGDRVMIVYLPPFGAVTLPYAAAV